MSEPVNSGVLDRPARLGGMIGGLIGLAFGWLWLVIGASATGAAQRPIVLAGSLLFAGAAFQLVRRGRGGSGRFAGRYYLAAVIGEVAAIALAQNWLAAHHREDLLFPVVGIIVGLHFIGLWLAWRRVQFLWLTGAMVAINLLALLLPLATRSRTMLSGLGSSAALLAAVMA